MYNFKLKPVLLACDFLGANKTDFNFKLYIFISAESCSQYDAINNEKKGWGLAWSTVKLEGLNQTKFYRTKYLFTNFKFY